MATPARAATTTAVPVPADLAGLDQAAELPPLTLVTGDQVRVGLDSDRNPVVEETTPAPWRAEPVSFQTFARDGATYVIPADVASLLDAGVLDWNLFNVVELGKLAAAGRVGEVPVLIDPADGAAAAAAATAPGIAPGQAYPEIDVNAYVIAGDGSWWQAVQAAVATAPAARLADAGPLAAIDKVWLEPVYSLSLDESVPQVSAPVAWAKGLDGTGVEVAVLDTGIDSDHPDVAGQIVEQVDFTGSPGGARDGHGHGTHVAATIAGTGAAAGGLRPGVAPGAKLRVGRVCGDGGTCPFDAIRDGMIWAAQSGVPVVNMSLGGGPTDGTDPLSRLVNGLSNQYGTLFVTSAGNDGPDPYTVSAPGAADEALAVAAVDKQDEMASFSSRGPRLGDDAPKPDIAAPGVGIVAARAAGTSMGTPVDEFYTSANGTSMASPHVAGAAAILAQKHPDLTGRQLKALLMSTAQDLGFAPEAQGAGRLDVGRAVDQTVFGGGPVSFGQQAYPHQPVTETIVYKNATDEPVTLDLATEFTRLGGQPAPDGLLTLDAEQVTVPAQGEIGVTLTLDGRVLDGSHGYGRYQGAVHAYDADGELRVSSRITAFLEPPRRDVTITITPPDGASAVTAFLGFVAVDEDVAVHEDPVVLQVGPSTTLEVFDGTYEFIGTINWIDEQGRWREALAPAPEVVVDGQAVEFALDLRQAKPAYTRTPEQTQPYVSSVRLRRVTGTGDWTHTASASTFYSAHHDPHAPSVSQSDLAPLVLPTTPVDTGTFTLASQEVRIPPPVTLQVVGGGEPLTLDPRYEVAGGVITNGQQQLGEQLVPFRTVMSPIPQLPGGRARLVDVGSGTPEELAAVDVRGALVLLDLAECNWSCTIWPSHSWVWDRLTALADQGAAGVLAYRSDQGRLSLGLTWPYRQYKCLDGWDSCPEPEPYSPLPIVTLPPGQDLALRERLDQGAQLIGLAGGQQRVERAYALTHVDDHVPDQLPWRVGARDLERVEHRLLAEGPGEVDLTWWPQYQGEAADLFLRVYMPRVPAQSALSVYHIKDERGYRYSSRRLPYVAPSVVDGFDIRYEGQQLRPGQATVDWNLPPVTPGPGVHPAQSGQYVPWNPVTCAGCRQGDVFYPTFYRVSGDGGRAGLIGPLNDRTNLTERVFGEFACEPPQCTVRMYDDAGAELPQRLVPLLTMDAIGYDLPAEPGRYTLEVNDGGVTTAWTYTSERPAVDDEELPVCMEDVVPGLGDEPCQDESLLFLRYDLGELDLDTTMPAGRSTTVQISGYYQQEESPPEVTELALEVTYDGGETWQPVATRAEGDGTFTATVQHPRLANTNGSVGMRVTASNDQGNSVIQTAPRVYGLR